MTDTLVQRAKKLATEHSKKAVAPETEHKRGAIIQLPIWPENTRGLPNALARSALFTTRYRKTKREYCKQKPIAALQGVLITYTGEELRQDDETVFMQLLHLAREVPLGEPVEFTPYSFLKSIKWHTSGSNHYKRLAATIERLAASLVGVTIAAQGKVPSIKYGGSLIRKFVYRDHAENKNLREWRIWFEPEIINLFQNKTFTRVEWDQRLELNKPLAQYLHSFYQTHAEPFPMKVDTLRELSGSAQQDLSAFRGTLNGALQELKNVGFLQKYQIEEETDLVHVKRH